MGSESTAHEAESRMGCRLGGHEGERNNNNNDNFIPIAVYTKALCRFTN